MKKRKSQRSTIKDVAREAGVSVATVSAVINKSRFVSDELMEKVLEAINKLDYYPNRVARGLKKQRIHTIAYIIPDINNPIFAGVTRGIQDKMEEMGYDVSLYNTDFSDKKLFRHLTTIVENRVSGVILSAWHSRKVMEAISLVQKLNIPLVIVHSPRNVEGVDSILVDEVRGAFEATCSLIEKRHTRIVSLGVKHSTTSRLREEGYRRALMEMGISQDGELMVQTEDFSREEAFSKMKQLYTHNQLNFSAIFAHSDLMAIGAMEATLEKGLRIPNDISVIGFDDTYASLTLPRLTTMHIPNYEMGSMAAEALFQELSSPSNDRSPQCRQIVPNFVERESVRDLSESQYKVK